MVVGAVRALGALLPALPPATLAPLLPGLIGPGGALLRLLGNCQVGGVGCQRQGSERGWQGRGEVPGPALPPPNTPIVLISPAPSSTPHLIQEEVVHLVLELVTELLVVGGTAAEEVAAGAGLELVGGVLQVGPGGGGGEGPGDAGAGQGKGERKPL